MKLRNGLAVVAMVGTFWWGSGAGGQTPAIAVTGKIEAVTVYRGEALVTRAVEVELPAGMASVVVGDLPTGLLPQSLYASSESAAEVRAVQFQPPEKAEQSEALAELERQIKQAEAELRGVVATQQALKEKQALLESLGSFTTARINAESEKLLPAPEAMKGLAEVLFGQHDALLQEDLRLRAQREAVEGRLEELRRQKAEASQGQWRMGGQAVLYVESAAAGVARLRVHYLVGQASWTPTYNLLADAAVKEARLEYLALVDQRSGEDWRDVRLTLSTASGAMAADAPALTPLWLTTSGDPGAAAVGGAQFREEAISKLAGALQQRANDARSSVISRDLAANEWAGRLQVMDLVGDARELRAGKAASTEAPLAVTYELPGAVSVDSGGRQQMVQVATVALGAEPYYVAEPVLTSYVYRHVDLVNRGGVALLRGPVKCYVDGQFVGMEELPVVAAEQRFTLGLGVDPQLRAFRELVEKEDRTSGRSRKIDFRYRLVLENYRQAPALVRVLDRLPNPLDEGVVVTLGKMTQKLSEDAVYQRTLRDEGILRWDVGVGGGAAGATAQTLEYAFRMEMDREQYPVQAGSQQVEERLREFGRKVESAR